MYSTFTVTLDTPIDIKNLIPYVLPRPSAFDSNAKQTSYNIECFGVVKKHCAALMEKLKKEDPDFSHRIHAKKATTQLRKDSTLVYRLKFTTNHNKAKQETHTNITMLGPLLEPKPLERQTAISTGDEELSEIDVISI